MSAINSQRNDLINRLRAIAAEGALIHLMDWQDIGRAAQEAADELATAWEANTELNRALSDGPADDAKDAARYRWLRDSKRIYLGPVIGRRDRDNQCRYIIAATSIGYCKADIETLDAAIDSARQSATSDEGR